MSEHSREKQSKIIKFLKQKRFFHGFVKKIVDICKFLHYIYVIINNYREGLHN